MLCCSTKKSNLSFKPCSCRLADMLQHSHTVYSAHVQTALFTCSSWMQQEASTDMAAEVSDGVRAHVYSIPFNFLDWTPFSKCLSLTCSWHSLRMLWRTIDRFSLKSLAEMEKNWCFYKMPWCSCSACVCVRMNVFACSLEKKMCVYLYKYFEFTFSFSVYWLTVISTLKWCGLACRMQSLSLQENRYYNCVILLTLCHSSVCVCVCAQSLS